LRNLYDSLVRPFIFLSSPEMGHRIAIYSFKQRWFWELLAWHFRVDDDRFIVSSGEVRLSNPLGLAAGFDKNCEMFESLSALGFGYLTLGSVTLNPREGNPKPRIWRYPNESLVNSMGLPNDGAYRISERLASTNRRVAPLILSISGMSLEEFSDCYLRLQEHADAIELNISTPNTAGVRIFQDPDTFAKLLDTVMTRRRDNKPVWVKLPPYFDEKTRENVLELVNTCIRKSVKAITSINTKLVKESRASIGTAGISGKEIFADMLRIVSDIYTHTDGKISINACGGIFSAEDAWKAFQAGATTIQLYTGFVYRGPSIVVNLKRQLLKFLEKDGYESITDVIGKVHK